MGIAPSPNPQAFVNEILPYAEEASAATHLDVQLIVAQWANETAWGTSSAWVNNANPAGIGITGTGVVGDNYNNLAGATQAYINFLENNSNYKPLLAAAQTGASLQEQALLLGQSGWAAGQYNNGGGPGSDLIQIIQQNPDIANLSPNSVPPATGATSGSAPSAAAAATTNSAMTGTTPANTPDSTDIGGVSYTGTEQQTTALSTIEANLQAYGFTPTQVSQLTNWAWGEITNNVDPTQIAVDLQAQPAFIAQFPGFASANAELQAKGLQAVSVTQYMQYQTQAQAMARAAGLPAGFINKDDIGQLIGHNVSTTELSNRLTDATALAYQSTTEQRNMFNQYFGTQYEHDTYIGEPGGTVNNDTGHGPLTHGQIAAIVLDPQKAEPLIHQQIAASQIGGAGVTAGVGAISKPLALQLAQAGITDSQALSGFQQIGPLAPLEKALPGQGGQAKEETVKPNQLAASQFLGEAGATRAIQVAQEVRKAPFSGGGGFQVNTRGSGVGPANNLGPVQQNL